MMASNGDRSRLESEIYDNVRRYREAAAPILSDLASVGFDVGSIAELARSKVNYRQAVPVLLRWLPNVDYRPLKYDILGALCVRFARPKAAPVLVDEFQRAPDWRLKWAIGSALSHVASDDVFDAIVQLVRDKRHGRGREMLAVALGNMKNPKAVAVLVELLDDDEVAGHALMALGKLRAKTARGEIERFLGHPKAWVRKEAKRALAKIDRAA